MPQDPVRVQEIFLRAVESRSEERPALLDQECSGDPAVRERVEALLEAHERSGRFLEPPGNGTGAYQPEPTRPGEYDVVRVFAGRYKLREKLGEGGMGVVFVADQKEPVQRRVALKIIKAGFPSSSSMARFEQERQALALMDHPNIAKVFDAGVAGGSAPDAPGVPYFVMELVKGLPLTKYCDEAKLSLRQRLELFIPVCHAVQHAHQKGIIHRDLKPSNILIGLYDGRPVPKVIDFGVAKATGARLTEQSIYTQVGSLIGTLEYMSPEQAELNNIDVDTRTDVYALGVILYELLTGDVPFSRKDLHAAGFAEMLRIIKEEEPSKPSTKLFSSETLPSIAASRHTEPKKLTALVRGELDWIVLKCLEKERSRRYDTADQLGLEIQRYLADEPVAACPPSRGYRLKKVLRKNKGAVIAASLVFLALAVGVVGTTLGLVRADRARQDAVTAWEAEAAQRSEAEQANRRAFAALLSFTDDLMQKKFTAKSELSDTDRSILRNALKQWEVFARSKGESPEARAIRAEGTVRVAIVQTRLGLYAEATANYRAAFLLWEGLVEEYPSDERYRCNLCEARGSLTGFLSSEGKNAEAQAQCRRLIAECERLHADLPLNPQYRYNLASSLLQLFLLAYDQLPLDDLESLCRRAQTHLEVVTADPNASPESRAGLSSCYNNLGTIAGRRGNLAAAESGLKQALQMRERLVKEFPQEADHRLFVADTLANISLTQKAMNKLGEAEESAGKGVAMREALVAEYPGAPFYRQELARAAILLAEVSLARDRLRAAVSAYDRALAAVSVSRPPDGFREVFASYVRGARVGRARALTGLHRFREALLEWDRVIEVEPPASRPLMRLARATTLACSGDHAGAVEVAEKIAEEPNPSGQMLYQCADVVALASTAVTGDAKLREAYARRTVELLQRAIEAGWNNAAHTARDPNFYSLRQRKDFKAVVAELERKAALRVGK